MAVPQLSHQPWFPRFLRKLEDEFLDFIVGLVHANRPFLPLFNEVLAHSKARTLVSFDAMDGGGLAHIAAEVGGLANAEFSVLLSDEHQDPDRVKRLHEIAGRPVELAICSKDEAAGRVRGRGVGVYLNTFHTLGHGEDRAALKRLVDQDLDVVIGEGNNKSFRQVVGMLLLSPLIMLLLTPLIRPFRPSRLLFTYLLPVLPLVSIWDGVAALFRLHTPEELEALAKSLGRADYVWKAGKRDNGRGGFVIYLLGYRRPSP
jgi:hypothetical protein